MAQQTALQQLIEWAISLKYNSQQCTDWICIKEKAEELLQMEKEQHYNTWLTAQMNYPDEDYIGIAETFEKYYNETYGKDSNEPNA